MNLLIFIYAISKSKNPLKRYLVALGLALTVLPVLSQPKATGDWNSLKREVPQWFRDAKFGIYFHWGVYTVPAFNSEWYSRSMYIPETGPNRHQVAEHGSLKNFGYKDYVPMFKAEHFNAEEWVTLFARAGAKFVGSIAEHADGFSMWASKVNPWNSYDMGPHKDVVGEMEKAVRKRHLKFLTTFHHQWQWGWYPTFDTSTDAGDPRYKALYGPITSKAAWQQNDSAERPDVAFCEQWSDKVKEVITRYKPDMLYFDSRLGHIQESYRRNIIAEYLGGKKAQGNNIVLYKGKDIPDSIGVRTHEKTRIDKGSDRPWLTEETISTYSWCYTEDMVIRNGADILKGMIDVVSKNGVYLLNVSPKADGAIPQNQKEVLYIIGDWLKKYGESIYNTRPWYIYGEGPENKSNQKNQGDRRKFFELKYTAEDIRYTTKGNTIYAILLGKPAEGSKDVILKSFSKENATLKMKVKKVSRIGSTEKIRWQYSEGGLSLTIPSDIKGEMPVVFKIETTNN